MAPTTFGAALEITQILLGGPVVEVESNPTITTSVGTAVEGNGDRVALVIVNQGANDVFIALNSGVSSSNGIRLTANGGSVALSVRDDFTLSSRKWYAVTAAATSAIYVLEYWRFTQLQAPQPGGL